MSFERSRAQALAAPVFTGWSAAIAQTEPEGGPILAIPVPDDVVNNNEPIEFGLSTMGQGTMERRHVPALMYHHISDTNDRFATSEAALGEQMAWLHANGYVTIATGDLSAAMTSGAPLPRKPVMLTIDDGNRSDHVFAATLARHGFRGVYFWPDTSPLSEPEMVELAEQGEIGAHTRTHPDLTTLARADQRADIDENARRLRDVTGQPVVTFAYPYGRFDEASSEVVAELGFDLAFDAWGEPTAVGDLDRLHVPRLEIPNGLSLDDFITRVEAWR